MFNANNFLINAKLIKFSKVARLRGGLHKFSSILQSHSVQMFQGPAIELNRVGRVVHRSETKQFVRVQSPFDRLCGQCNVFEQASRYC